MTKILNRPLHIHTNGEDGIKVNDVTVVDKDGKVVADITAPAGSIGTSELAASAVTTAKIADLNVTTGKIAADAVDNTKLADNAVSLENIDAAAKPIFHVVGAGIFTTAGGDANESITVSGCLETDTAVVWVQKAGASPVTVDTVTPGTDAVAVVLSDDPSTDHKLGYIVIRAAA